MLKRDGGHNEQLLEPGDDVLPESHRRQLLWPVALVNRPGRQFRQVEAVGWRPYLPIAQGEQLSALLDELKPG